MDRLLYNVGELSTPARSAVEGLMGHPLRDDQRLYIVALEAADEPPALDATLAPLRAEFEASGMSEAELVDLLETAKHQLRAERRAQQVP
jgi:hypothetical protein